MCVCLFVCVCVCVCMCVCVCRWRGGEAEPAVRADNCQVQILVLVCGTLITPELATSCKKLRFFDTKHKEITGGWKAAEEDWHGDARCRVEDVIATERKSSGEAPR